MLYPLSYEGQLGRDLDAWRLPEPGRLPGRRVDGSERQLGPLAGSIGPLASSNARTSAAAHRCAPQAVWALWALHRGATACRPQGHHDIAA